MESPHWKSSRIRGRERTDPDKCAAKAKPPPLRNGLGGGVGGLVARSQQAPPPSTLKNASISASVPTSPSRLKSALAHVVQQLPARQAKKASMSASVPTSPSPLKS